MSVATHVDAAAALHKSAVKDDDRRRTELSQTGKNGLFPAMIGNCSSETSADAAAADVSTKFSGRRLVAAVVFLGNSTALLGSESALVE